MFFGLDLLSSYGINTIRLLFLGLDFLSSIPVWIWILGIVVLLAISSYLLYKIKEALRKIDKLESQVEKSKQGYSRTINDLKRELSKVKRDNISEKQFVNEDNVKQHKETDEKPFSKEYRSEAVEIELEIDVNKPRKELFLPFPYEERKLYDGNRSESPNNDTFYRIALEGSLLEGKLFVQASDHLIINAFNSPEMYLKRACDYVNTLDSNIHSEIQTAEPGKVRLEGDDWVVNEKVKIKFV